MYKSSFVDFTTRKGIFSQSSGILYMAFYTIVPSFSWTVFPVLRSKIPPRFFHKWEIDLLNNHLKDLRTKFDIERM